MDEQSSKRLASDSSSLADLKAELFRKRQEASLLGSSRNGLAKPGPSRPASTSDKNDRKDKVWQSKTIKEKRDPVESEEAERARISALRAKAELYERLKAKDSKLLPDDLPFLVSFKRTSSGSEEDDGDDDGDDEDGEFVEYTDPLGRTRTVHRNRLSQLKSRDADLAPRVADGRPGSAGSGSMDRGGADAAVGGGDPARPVGGGEDDGEDDANFQKERMRKLREKWDMDEEENLKKDRVHYNDVLFDEARTHGAGFYGFSRDEGQRFKEMQQLEKAHKEAQEARARREAEREDRQTAMEARLQKVRDRKRLKMGLPIKQRAPEGQQPASASAVSGTVGNVPDELDVLKGLRAIRQKQQQQEEEQRERDRAKKVRDWDVGKMEEDLISRQKRVESFFRPPVTMPGTFKPKSAAAAQMSPSPADLMDQKEWVAKQRLKRPAEFAPPSAYRHPGLGQGHGGRPGPQSDQGATTADENGASRGSRGAEVPPPCQMDYYSNIGSCAKKPRANVRNLEQGMAESFRMGMDALSGCQPQHQ